MTKKPITTGAPSGYQTPLCRIITVATGARFLDNSYTIPPVTEEEEDWV